MERSRSYSEKSSGRDNSAYVTDLRCHSASYVSSHVPHNKDKKATKSTTRQPPPPPSSSSSSAAASAGSKARISWSGFGDPELQRKRRVAGYRVYGVERRVKGSLKSGARWLKGKCTRVVDGWW